MRKRIWVPEAPFIIAQRPRTLEVVCPKVSLRGIFSWELYNVRTHRVERRGRGDNIITNTGLEYLSTQTRWNDGGVSNAIQYCAVGTGTVPEAATDVALGNELIRTNFNGGTLDSGATTAADLSYRSQIRTRSFTQAQANGNLTEVGMFSASTGGTMFCRQLLRDEVGNPTTIVKTSDYELRISYEIRLYHPGDLLYSMLVDGVARNVLTRAGLFGSAWKPFGNVAQSGNGTTIWAYLTTGAMPATVNSGLSGGIIGSFFHETDGGLDTYVAGSHQLVYHQRWTATQANDTNYTLLQTGCIGSFSTNAANIIFNHAFQDGFSISKTNLQRFDLSWVLSWDRYTP